jgi:KaiC/GvpD/RAD55 family RecA-like ATPase
MGLFDFAKKKPAKRTISKSRIVKKSAKKVKRSKIPSKKQISKLKFKKSAKKVTPKNKLTPSKFLKKGPSKKPVKLTTKPIKTKLRKDELNIYIKCMVPGFDKLLTKGIPGGNSVLVEGSAGVGKTIFTLQLAYQNAMQGKKVLYMSFEEPERRLIRHMKEFGWDAPKMIKNGNLRIQKLNALDIARSVEALLSEAKKELLIDVQPVFFPDDFNPDIVCIDSLSAIASAFSGEESRFRIYMEQLFQYLESKDITSFLVVERPNPAHTGLGVMGEEAVSFLSDGIISIYNILFKNGRRSPALEVIKMRGAGFDKKIVRMDIVSGKGLIVYPNKIIARDKGVVIT